MTACLHKLHESTWKGLALARSQRVRLPPPLQLRLVIASLSLVTEVLQAPSRCFTSLVVQALEKKIEGRFQE